ncbi:YdcF family protein [Asaia platycodi]|uniref:YdcF family protein n=1 Tax=Asaia platycodi TaxID=610243 RepID=UPI000472BB12|nr:YdcF family protein [Asaia platycodi]
MSERFAALHNPEIRERADRIAEFLALTSVDDAPNRIDLICLAGNGVLACVDHAASLARHHGCLLLITGGIGHSTAPLMAALAARLDCAASVLAGLSEAELVARLITADALVSPGQIILETRSTNTGENAAFTRDTLDELGLTPHHIELIQDPLLQRRTEATFRHIWQNTPTRFFSSPPFVPRLGDTQTAESWTEERYLSLLLGEIPRLHDNEEGYGPKGKGFIGHVEIPQEILDDHAALASIFAAQAGR